MEEMEEIQLRVEIAFPVDLGKGIIRLDPTTLRKLQLSIGDTVEIKGKKKTTAKVWRADRYEWNKYFVRIDNFIQQNAGVSIGEKVTIKKVEAPEAKKLFLALPESIMQGGPELQFGEHANEIIKQHILKRPVFMGDIIPIINSMSQSMTESLTTSQVIPLVAVETDPSNTIVKVSEETIIELSHKTVKPVKSPEETAIELTNEIVQFPEKKKKSVFKSTINYANQILKSFNLAIISDEVTGELNLCETEDTFISATKNVQKKITFSPSVFEIPKKPNVPNCVSVMMPFSIEFDDVYECIKDVCYEVGMSCHRADDFWHHSAII